MHQFNATLLRYNSKAEKTGWTFVHIPPDVIKRLHLKSRKGFRIKGQANDVKFEKLSVYPVGDGEFIIAFNGSFRKKLRKNEGAVIQVKFTLDIREADKSSELLECLEQDTEAKAAFEQLKPSHQNYYHRYVFTAKTAETKAARILNVINAMHKGLDFGQMMRSLKK